MEKNLVTIIIPVFNVERYIVECLESVVCQSYNNIEIIIINDGSTDNSLSVCERYARMDSRIALYSKENGGLSEARNYGLDRANGEFIMFLDSDDYLSRNCVESMVNSILETKADIVSGRVRRFVNPDDFLYDNGSIFSEVLNKHDAMREMLQEGKTNTMACAKLYRSELFDTVRFCVGKYHEDIYIMHILFDRIHSLSIIGDVVYYYRLNSNSISEGVFTVRRKDAVYAERERLDFVQKYYPEFINIQIEKYIWNCVNNNYRIIRSKSLKCNIRHFRSNSKEIRRYLFRFLASKASVRSKLCSIACTLLPI